jgi:hypothetical protein
MNWEMRLLHRVREHFWQHGIVVGPFLWKMDDATLDGSTLTTDVFSVYPWSQGLVFNKGSIGDLERFCHAHNIVFKDVKRKPSSTVNTPTEGSPHEDS